ncbi:hypothetical protein NM688_g4937 [Phlebia brevispora]|uniref:Uncharacterized protein n=1 Tax=Phlebia brevispora TaxID=194682 RepID=A0ACC1T182_9APHY|nr:hypothetical protein NM688_g4937 [Phlebia brevispora]
MNVVREINKINERELDLGITGSWHDDYKDSAYIFIGGLHSDLTEGDVITIFSQYGEVMDVNLPRDKNTGKTKGFGFLMYEDQRSTVLAVDNLNGAKVLERTLRVDHVKNYKQPRSKNEEGEWVDREEQSLNAKPELIIDENAASESEESDYSDIDPEDPMRDFLIAQRKEEKAKKKKKSKKGKHKDETPEERWARKERKRLKKLKKSEGVKGVEQLLNELEGRHRHSRDQQRSPSPEYRRPTSVERRTSRDRPTSKYSGERRDRSPSRTPPRDARPPPRSRSPSRRTRRSDDRSRSPYSRDDDRTPPRRGLRT